ncbi:MAG: hypothetical protein ACRD3O_01815 [Terriglobia bacterium]
MKGLDDELRSLLRRKEPPEGFAERVLARVEAANARLNFARPGGARFRRPRMGPLGRMGWMGWIAAAAACLLLAISLVRYQRHQRTRAEADLAGQQATVALHIASAQLTMALRQAQQITERALAAESKGRKEQL